MNKLANNSNGWPQECLESSCGKNENFFAFILLFCGSFIMKTAKEKTGNGLLLHGICFYNRIA